MGNRLLGGLPALVALKKVLTAPKEIRAVGSKIVPSVYHGIVGFETLAWKWCDTRSELEKERPSANKSNSKDRLARTTVTTGAGSDNWSYVPEAHPCIRHHNDWSPPRTTLKTKTPARESNTEFVGGSFNRQVCHHGGPAIALLAAALFTRWSHSLRARFLCRSLARSFGFASTVCNGCVLHAGEERERQLKAVLGVTNGRHFSKRPRRQTAL